MICIGRGEYVDGEESFCIRPKRHLAFLIVIDTCLDQDSEEVRVRPINRYLQEQTHSIGEVEIAKGGKESKDD